MEKFLENSNYKYGVIHEFNGINGGLYDAIEYTHILSTIGPTNLIIINNRCNINTIRSTIENVIKFKYIININDLNIVIHDKYRNKINRNKYDSLLFVDSGIIKYLPLYMAKKYCILADYIPFTIPLYYNKVKKFSNVYTFNEMPYFPSDINYKFKFNFNIFKTYDKLENNTLVSYKDLNRQNNQHIMKLFSNDTGEEIKFNEYPINNFHSRFNKYIYNNINFFDPRCRLVIECFYYGITLDNIIRNIKKENYDGAYYRLKDLKENGLEGRYLDINDEAIQVMIE